VNVVTGTVTDDSDPTHPVVQVDGETPKAVKAQAWYTPVNGDRVAVIIQGGYRLCIGD
jgi:hypothetical protein